MAAYHLEALRRQRVIDRKVEALTRMSIKQEEEERQYRKQLELVAEERLEEEATRNREREEHLRQRGGRPCRTGYQKSSDKQTQVKFQTQSDLRHQSKILRDSGLVMGNVNEQFFS